MRLRPSLFLLKTDGNNYCYPLAAYYERESRWIDFMMIVFFNLYENIRL